ncbi:MAG TPA: Ig-like domain-containing protein [Thermoleophilaceae bacterium]|nr:Ig-like domain-containing protein [Thermoleophilaceae bacterium]
MRKRIALIALCGLTVAAPSAAASARAERALHKAESTLRGHSAKPGADATLALKELAVRLPSLHGRDRTRARRLLERPLTTAGTRSGDVDFTGATHDPPLCSAHFCIHWVDEGADAPPAVSSGGDGVPDYIRTMSQVFEQVHAVENGRLGWRAPRSDGRTGGQGDRVDVYIKDVGSQGIFGYSAPDPGQHGNSQHAYLVMDNDYSRSQFARYANYLAPMQVTAAHEYNHVLQFTYDVFQDSWFMESTAVWAEDVVYPDVNDYLAYLNSWSLMSDVPLTAFDELDQTDPVNLKAYGDAAFARWVDSHYGAGVIRAAWERSTATIPASFAPGAYDAALNAHGSSFFQAFARFAADTAEWRSSAGPFRDGDSALWPDLRRASPRRLAPGSGVLEGRLDHTAYVLADVRPTPDPRIKLVGSLPRGTAGALALVGRVGPEATGRVEVALKRLPRGGGGSVVLARPGRFSRVTAVIVNADSDPNGFSQTTGAWAYANDRQAVRARVSNRFAPLKLTAATPAAGARVSRKARVVLNFSAALDRGSLRSIRLRDSRGKRVRVRVKRSHDGRRVTLVPREPLDPGERYELELGSSIVDRDMNPLAAPARGWTFVTRK